MAVSRKDVAPVKLRMKLLRWRYRHDSRLAGCWSIFQEKWQEGLLRLND
jgi:hypothetical protein